MATADVPAARYFTLFPKLAVELRLRIWRLTFPPTRVLEIPITAESRTLQHQPSAASPVALFVNCESRYETLRLYRPLMRHSHIAFVERKAIYFDPDVDIIRIREHPHTFFFWEAYPLKQFLSEGGVLDYVKHITFHNAFWGPDDEANFKETKDEDMRFHCFKALESLKLVFYPGYSLILDYVAEDCRVVMEWYLENFKMANPDCKIPKITTVFPPLQGTDKL